MVKKTLLYFGVLQVVLALVIVANAQTTTITFSNVPTAILPSLVAAMDAQYPRLPSELPSNNTNDMKFIKRCTRDFFWKPLVNNSRQRSAAIAAPVVTGDDFGN